MVLIRLDKLAPLNLGTFIFRGISGTSLSHYTVVWVIVSLLCVVCLLFFVCTVTDFSAAEKTGA